MERKDINLGLVLVASALVIIQGLFLGMAGLIEAVSPHRGLGYGKGLTLWHGITYLGSNHLPEDLFSISW